MSRILELFGRPTFTTARIGWRRLVEEQKCPFLNRQCVKVRKSQPEIAIGTCTVAHGKDLSPVVICPHRLLERRQVFMDSLHLLSLHEPGNELHVVPEVTLPGGSVDYFLVSSRNRKVGDFVGVEFRSLDSTGTVWPERQRFLRSVRVRVRDEDVESPKPFGMNWKMTAKTILVQLHHKVETFEQLSKHFVLALQECFLDYMQRRFSLDHLETGRLGDPMHFHAYSLQQGEKGLQISLAQRLSTDSAGIAKALGLQARTSVEYEELVELLEARISSKTLLTV